ncbi:MAG: efflux RND transporter periplasmic adaptor subunit [Deltaproteobacteria bacterium]|nr:efflux RND transporter periplasmic adaptor subunit [Deltaproteobacteria bacterium]
MLRNKRFYFIIFTAVFLLTGCGEKIEPGNVEPSTKGRVKAPVVSAKIISQPFFYESVGTVSAKIVSTISSKLLGSVKEVFVREGDPVNKGDRLAVIDDRQVSARLRQAKAALAEARRAETAAGAGAELAKATYTRYRNLMKDASASAQEFDEIKSGYQQAQAGLAAAKQRVNQAQASLSSAVVSAKDAVILAPYDGTIRAKMVEVGDLATPGKPLFALETTGNYIVDLFLPEQYIHTVGLNQEVTVTVSALNNKTFTGSVQTIFPAADTKSRSFLVKVSIPADKALRSGMFARVSIPIGKAGLILIPATAVIHSGQLTGMYIVDDTQTAKFRLIRTGRTFGESIEVLSGLKQGDRYVTAPPPTLINGMKVEIDS